VERAEPGPVLVANRGEIAVRIVRACRELGLRSIVVHSDVDAGSLPTRLADVAVPVASYLDVDAVVGAGVAEGAWAVHPGYGLLAENAGFARAVVDAGLAFVGPPAEVVAAMGDKVRARALARDCGVPVLDGTDGPVASGDAGAAAAEIGFPLLVKAAHGGGGRGMRVVRGPDELPGALAAATREASAAFGRGEVFLERHVARPRHVEVQVLADHHGGVAVLGDRDCTVQRRHQKLLEEAPAPDLPDTLRAELHDAARRLAVAVGYRGAGTVEFLLDRDTGAPSFLEMNTRLQVEHGVTELVTGVDLVVAQLRIAAGEALSAIVGDGDVPVRGHAVQARIAAEDPWEGFRPAPGRVSALVLPSGPWVRCDLGVEAGDAVSGAYDSLLGKVHA
jgi:acetyl-CoA/propionyl-CoA carboxylase, biotin carboxylase, biotin carboxyl carrier protein